MRYLTVVVSVTVTCLQQGAFAPIEFLIYTMASRKIFIVITFAEQGFQMRNVYKGVGVKGKNDGL